MLKNMTLNSLNTKQHLNYLFSQIITGPSGSGKGILLQSMILDIYEASLKGYIFGLLQSPLIVIGHQLKNTFKTS